MSQKIVLVTGASRGIGQAIAHSFGTAGYFVIGTATTEAGAAAITQSLQEQGMAGYGKVLNILDKESIDTLFEDLKSQNHQPLILVNNAGLTRDNLVLRMKDEEWDTVIAADLTSVFKMSRAALKTMMKAKWGRIIHISSVSGGMGLLGQANYSAAKAGISGFSKALAKEMAAWNITVNSVAPGFIQSDMTDALPADFKEKILTTIPLNRVGQPQEVAALVNFLASDHAGYITGQTIHVNGGLFMP